MSEQHPNSHSTKKHVYIFQCLRPQKIVGTCVYIMFVYRYYLYVFTRTIMNMGIIHVTEQEGQRRVRLCYTYYLLLESYMLSPYTYNREYKNNPCDRARKAAKSWIMMATTSFVR